MKNIFETIVSILIAQWVIYIVSKLTGKSIYGLKNKKEALPDKGNKPVFHKKEDAQLIDEPVNANNDVNVESLEIINKIKNRISRALAKHGTKKIQSI
jgi:hypothetical protein